MERYVYPLSLVLVALINFALAVKLQLGTREYARYPIYRRTRILTTVWLTVFGIGYLLHAIFGFRFSCPAIATALTTTCFHVGAICFSWGYTSLLDPNYLTRRVVIRDLLIYAIGVVCYWTVALTWREEPFYATIATAIFFLYAAYGTFIFYRTYNLVSLETIKITNGSVSSFAHWMQLCCDLIILFGIGCVALVAIFPNTVWTYIVLCWLSPVVYGYIFRSLDKYGTVVKATAKDKE